MPEFPITSTESSNGIYVEAIVEESEALDPVEDTQGVLEDDRFPGKMSWEGNKLVYKGTLESREQLALLQALMQEVRLRFSVVTIADLPLNMGKAA